jgi:hypothetical protein
MDARFRIWVGRFEELAKRGREVELKALLAMLFKELGHPVEDESSSHPNGKRSRHKEFTPAELAEIEERKKEVQKGWSLDEHERRKHNIV